MQVVVEGTEEAGYVGGMVSEIAGMLSDSGPLGERKTVEDEIDLMLRTVREFWELEPDERMQLSSAMSARCTELCVHLHRLEGKREWRQVRTQQVERLLLELDRQFKLASRLVEVRRQDLELIGR